MVKIRPALEGDKEAVLLSLCTRTFKEKVIIFRFVAPHYCSKSLMVPLEILFRNVALLYFSLGMVTKFHILSL